MGKSRETDYIQGYLIENGWYCEVCVGSILRVDMHQAWTPDAVDMGIFRRRILRQGWKANSLLKGLCSNCWRAESCLKQDHVPPTVAKQA